MTFHFQFRIIKVMKTEKKNLRDLVAASQMNITPSESIYANLRNRYSPKKLEAYLAGLSEEEKTEYIAYCESPEGKREQKEYEAKERQAAKIRANNRKNNIFHERLAKIKLKIAKSEELRARLAQTQTLTLNEIAESLILFPELLPSGHKAPSLTLARKQFKGILTEAEKEYLVHTWADTTIPVELCYSEVRQPYTLNTITS